MLRFSNFGKALVGSAPSGTSGLSFTVEAGKGVNFPSLDTGDYFYGIFKDASGNREIVKIEARSGDAMTIAVGGRGLDGTTARTWNAGDYFVAGLTNVALQESLSNANLTALGALVSAADKLPYFTGSGAAALTSLSAFARTLLDDADAGTARSTLGALASSVVSAYMLTLLGDTSAADARATLGVSYGPAFRVAQSASQALTSAANTKITLGSEEFDTNSNFASSRFTPTVAGYYQLNWLVGVSASSITNAYAMLFKNGVEQERGSQLTTAASMTVFASHGSAVVFMNGTTDYLEVYANFTGTSLSATYSRFSGCLMRPA